MNKSNTSSLMSVSLPNSPCESLREEVHESRQPRHLTPETEIFLMQPFVSQRLSQWHTNEEVYKILEQCNQLSTLALKNSYYKQLKEERFSREPVRMPKNGSVLVFDRREVKNYKKDCFLWKRRKTGSSKSVREDRMSLKVNGVESIYGCYSHSYIMSTFHRRIYWLLGKPDIVLVHYLQIPNNESVECLMSINLKNSDFQFNQSDVSEQLRSMIWPYYLYSEFVQDNLKLNSLPLSSEQDDFKISFLSLICASLFESKTIRINFSKFIKNLSLTQNDLEQQKVNNKSSENATTLADDKFIKHESYSTNQVKLSLEYCSSEGGERLMLISDWKGEQYHIIINEKILNLCKLNTHVLETLLPKFENLTSSTNKTLIYVFENQQLFSEPIPFEIKHSSVNPTNSDSYKNKFFLLERVLMLYKYYRLNSFDGELQVQSSSSQDSQIPISFESRLGQMIENLISHLSLTNITSSSTGQFVFNDEHEGKTLVNLCIDLDHLSIFKWLGRLKSLVNLKKELDLSLLKNELDLFVLDHHGINPLMLICRKGNQCIANEAFKWVENDLSSETSTQIVSSWIYSLLKSKEEANKHSHAQIVRQLDHLLERAHTKISYLNSTNSINNQSANLTNELDLNLIDNIDLSSFLDNSENTSSLFPTIELDHVITNSDLTNLLSQTDLGSECSFNEPSRSQAEQLIDPNDDQNDKIKTLADNIIAAMPHKIKINNYSQNDFESASNNVLTNKPVQVLNRNSASFDENIILDFGDANLEMIENCSSYSNRSSLSLASSQSFQFLNEMQTKESSPDENSNSSSFHIDSPPSTAEFCQYFHASSSSRCSIETGFAQLTLTDAEQRELYEAALVIQNAYRRYMKRKKKRFKSDLEVKLSANSVFFSLDESEKNTSLYLMDSTSSLYDVHNTQNNLVDDIHHQTYDLVTPSNSNSNIDQQKQFEAASIIQKYYRRYKQYEKLQNEAASKIQKRYRAYKLNDYRKSNFYHNSIDETSTENHSYVYSNELPLNQRVIQRKILNMRQTSRFSPSSPGSSSSNSLISSQILPTRISSDISSDDFSNNNTSLQSKQNFNSILFETKANINNFINTNIVESNELFNNR